jgi:hypothetical protein
LHNTEDARRGRTARVEAMKRGVEPEPVAFHGADPRPNHPQRASFEQPIGGRRKDPQSHGWAAAAFFSCASIAGASTRVRPM